MVDAASAGESRLEIVMHGYMGDASNHEAIQRAAAHLGLIATTCCSADSLDKLGEALAALGGAVVVAAEADSALQIAPNPYRNAIETIQSGLSYTRTIADINEVHAHTGAETLALMRKDDSKTGYAANNVKLFLDRCQQINSD